MGLSGSQLPSHSRTMWITHFLSEEQLCYFWTTHWWRQLLEHASRPATDSCHLPGTAVWELRIRSSPVCFQPVFYCGSGAQRGHTTLCVPPELRLLILGGHYREYLSTYSCTLMHTYACTLIGVFAVSSPTSCKDQIQNCAVQSWATVSPQSPLTVAIHPLSCLPWPWQFQCAHARDLCQCVHVGHISNTPCSCSIWWFCRLDWWT